jgi:hypothetical protein
MDALSIGTDVMKSSLAVNGFNKDTALVSGQYHAVCTDKDGNVKWDETFDNLVTRQGADFLLACIVNVPGSTPTFTPAQPYVGLITTVGAADATSTMATPVFTETAATVVATRGTPVWGATTGTVTPHDRASSAISFSVVTATNVNIAGCFLVTGTGASSTVLNTGGTLYSMGAFTTGGTKVVNSGDTINVTYTARIAF